MGRKDPMVDETTEELLSRALDGDLDRAEMRALFARMGDAGAEGAALMGRMARVEEGLQGVAEGTAAAQPERPAPATPATPGIARDRRSARVRRALASRPAAAAYGAAAAALAAVLAVGGPGERDATVARDGTAAPHLAVHAVDRTAPTGEAGARTTHKYFLQPGARTRVVTGRAPGPSLHVRLESAAPARVEVVQAGDGRPARPRTVNLNGYASIIVDRPRAGEALLMANTGAVPVVVYVSGGGNGGPHIQAATTTRPL